MLRRGSWKEAGGGHTCTPTERLRCVCVGGGGGGRMTCTHPKSTKCHIVQELCESRGGRAGLSVLTSFLASVDVKIY